MSNGSLNWALGDGLGQISNWLVSDGDNILLSKIYLNRMDNRFQGV